MIHPITKKNTGIQPGDIFRIKSAEDNDGHCRFMLIRDGNALIFESEGGGEGTIFNGDDMRIVLKLRELTGFDFKLIESPSEFADWFTFVV